MFFLLVSAVFYNFARIFKTQLIINLKTIDFHEKTYF